MKKDYDIDECDNEGYTTLMWISEFGNKKVVRMLLNNNADINAQGGYFGNALQAVSSGGHEKLAQILLNNNTHVNTQGGEYGNTL